MPFAPSVENGGFTKYMARASTVLSAIHVRLIHASVWLHRNRRDVGPSVAFERQRRIAAGGWQRPVFFSVEIVAGRNQNWNRAVPRYRRVSCVSRVQFAENSSDRPTSALRRS